MREPVLVALMHLFALAESLHLKAFSAKGRTIAASFLRNISRSEEFIKLYDDYLDFYERELKENESPGLQELMVKRLGKKLCRELMLPERLVVLIRLTESFLQDGQLSTSELSFLESIANEFNITIADTKALLDFAQGLTAEWKDRSSLLVIESPETESSDELEGAWIEQNKPISGIRDKVITREGLVGKIEILHLSDARVILFKYSGSSELFINQQKAEPGLLYLLTDGCIIRGNNVSPVYFSEIIGRFYQADKPKIILQGKDISFSFGQKGTGIAPFSFCEESGHLVGIIGGSGVGKSTLLRLLNGQLPLKSGTITINGYDLHRDKFRLQGMIGYVPQDDLLFEELTVYQNLFYNACLCFGNMSKQEITGIVNKTISELGLEEIRDLKVGTPLNNILSGGQRKRLNIGLELMREPSVLLVDEPTSGLSSTDAERVMLLLREQANKGKLVIINIHQPSSNIFRLFDSIWVLDRGGYPVYAGNPIEAVHYFKTIAFHANALENECPVCGNIDTEQILRILEAREIDEQGKLLGKRRRQPEEWYRLYKENILQNDEPKAEKSLLPRHVSGIPSETRQMVVFSKRNLLSKIGNIQYLIIAFLEAPLLALILAWFTRYETESGYFFSENKNIPQYLFMAVIVALFIGLTISAEEIIKDRRILLRESYLNLSWFSYINSKVMYLFALSAIQTMLFALVGNLILGNHDMIPAYWMVLFSTACFANLLGLNLSSGLKSVIAIYITVPLLLVPQLLFSGVIVSFDDLHKSLTRRTVVPIIGEIMASRWAYEALAVEQFSHNAFQKHFFKAEQEISEAGFNINFLIPRLENVTRTTIRKLNDSAAFHERENNLKLLQNEVKKFPEYNGLYPFEYADSMNAHAFSETIGEELLDYLTYVRLQFLGKLEEGNRMKDSVYNSLLARVGEDGIYRLKSRSHNNRLAEVVQNKNDLVKYIEVDNRIIPKKDPIYVLPESDYGRAHFYAAYKRLNGQYIDTLWFNLVVIWLMTFILYAILLTNGLAKILEYFGRKTRP